MDMTKRNEDGMAERQKALDYLNAHPGATSREVQNALDWRRSTASGRLLDMWLMGEVRRESEPFEDVPGYTIRYWANVKVAKRLEELEVSLATLRVEYRKKREREIKRPPTKTMLTPVYRSRDLDPNRPPIKDQGGQGTVTFGIRSSLGDIL